MPRLANQRLSVVTGRQGSLENLLYGDAATGILRQEWGRKSLVDQLIVHEPQEAGRRLTTFGDAFYHQR